MFQCSTLDLLSLWNETFQSDSFYWLVANLPLLLTVQVAPDSALQRVQHVCKQLGIPLQILREVHQSNEPDPIHLIQHDDLDLIIYVDFPNLGLLYPALQFKVVIMIVEIGGTFSTWSKFHTWFGRRRSLFILQECTCFTISGCFTFQCSFSLM
jgi:hypothetical protein